MAKDNEAAREEQAADWREKIKELTSTDAAQQKGTATQDETAHTEAQHSTSSSSPQENSPSQSPAHESARDFIQRKMREKEEKGGD